MSKKSPSFEEEIERWHRFSDGAIGPMQVLMALFLATVPDDLRGQLRDAIHNDLRKDAQCQSS